MEQYEDMGWPMDGLMHIEAFDDGSAHFDQHPLEPLDNQPYFPTEGVSPAAVLGPSPGVTAGYFYQQPLTDLAIQPDAMPIVDKELEAIIGPSGGVLSEGSLQILRDLCTKADKPANRESLLRVLAKTAEPILNHFAEHYEGLTILESWLQQAKKDARYQHVLLILSVLENINMTLKFLKTTSIGKTVNKLTKAQDNKEVADRAKALVEKWKKQARTAAAASTSSAGSSTQATSNTAKQTAKQSSVTGSTKTEAPASSVNKAKPAPPKVASTSSVTQTSTTGATQRRGGLILPEHMTKTPKQVVLQDASPSRGPSLSPLDELQIFERPAKRPKLEPTPEGDESSRSDTQSTTEQSPSNAMEIAEDMDSSSGDDEMDDDVDTDNFRPGPSSEPPAAVPDVQISQKTGKPKKRVSWADDDKLVKIKYFTKEEEAGPTQHTTLKQDMINEGAQLRLQKQQEEADWRRKREEMAATIEWTAPQRVCVRERREPLRSLEAEVQARREEQLFRVFYTKESDIPNTPKDPEEPAEIYDDTKLPQIPQIEPSPQLGTPLPQLQPTGVSSALASLLGLNNLANTLKPLTNIATTPPITQPNPLLSFMGSTTTTPPAASTSIGASTASTTTQPTLDLSQLQNVLARLQQLPLQSLQQPALQHQPLQQQPLQQQLPVQQQFQPSPVMSSQFGSSSRPQTQTQPTQPPPATSQTSINQQQSQSQPNALLQLLLNIDNVYRRNK